MAFWASLPSTSWLGQPSQVSFQIHSSPGAPGGSPGVPKSPPGVPEGFPGAPEASPGATGGLPVWRRGSECDPHSISRVSGGTPGAPPSLEEFLEARPLRSSGTCNFDFLSFARATVNGIHSRRAKPICDRRRRPLGKISANQFVHFPD